MKLKHFLLTVLTLFSYISLPAMQRTPGNHSSLPVVAPQINDYCNLPRRKQNDTSWIIHERKIVTSLSQKPHAHSLQQLKNIMNTFYCLSYLTASETEKCYLLRDLLHALCVDTEAQRALGPVEDTIKELIVELLNKVQKRADRVAQATAPTRSEENYPSLKTSSTKKETQNEVMVDGSKETFIGELESLIELCSCHFRSYSQLLVNVVMTEYAAVKNLAERHRVLLYDLHGTEKQFEADSAELADLELRVTGTKTKKGTTNERKRKSQLKTSIPQLTHTVGALREAYREIRQEIAQNKGALDRLYATLYWFNKRSLILTHNTGCKTLGDLCTLDQNMVESIFLLEEESRFKNQVYRAIKEFSGTEHELQLLRTLQQYICLMTYEEHVVKGFRWEITVALYFHDKDLLKAWGQRVCLPGTYFFREIDFLIHDGKETLFVECKNCRWSAGIHIGQQLRDQHDIAQQLGARVILLSKYPIPVEQATQGTMLLLEDKLQIEYCDIIYNSRFAELFKAPYFDYEETR